MLGSNQLVDIQQGTEETSFFMETVKDEGYQHAEERKVSKCFGGYPVQQNHCSRR